MLLGEGDADDGDEEQRTKEEVHQAGPQASEDDPNQIQRDADAADGAIRVFYLRTERPKTQQTYLKSLQRHGNTDDGNS